MSYQNNYSSNPNTHHNSVDNNRDDINFSENDSKNINCIELQQNNGVNSITSKEISIKSLNDDNDESIITDDSSDYEEKENNYTQVISEHSNKLHNVIERSNLPRINDNENNIEIELNQNKGVQIENLSVQNSNDITIGNKTIYNGPVTINQFVTNSLNKNVENVSDNEYSNLKNNQKQRYNIFKIFNKSSAHRKKSIIILSSVLFILIVILIGIIYVYLIKPYQENELDIDWNIRVIKRNEWGARPPKEELDPFVITPYRALIAHTVTEECSTNSSCLLRLKFIQNFMMDKLGFDDIGYNFLVGGNGMVYEGCGWDKIGIHTRGYNNNTICIAFMGNFNYIKPPKKQLQAAQWILNECVKAGKLTSNYKLYGVRQVQANDSPGHELYKIIKKWTHWSDDIE